MENLTIPSQRRYVQYFSNMLDGVKPRAEPLLLRRIIINSIPIFGTLGDDHPDSLGCCPYLQLFKNGKLIATAAPCSLSDSIGAGAKSKPSLRWIKAEEGSMSFTVDVPIQGDVLLRCRHVSVTGTVIYLYLYLCYCHMSCSIITCCHPSSVTHSLTHYHLPPSLSLSLSLQVCV